MNKKVILLSLSFSITAISTSFCVLSADQINGLANNSTSKVYGHYVFVEPTSYSYGCREFWISCDEHEIVFEEPEGTIINRGQPTQQQINEWKYDDSKRVIPQIGETVQFGSYPQGMYGPDEPYGEYRKQYVSVIEINPEDQPPEWYKSVDVKEYNGQSIYFILSSINWIVVGYDEGRLELFACDILDSTFFYYDDQDRIIDDKIIHPNNYEYSNVRYLVNNLAYSALNSAERECLVETEIDNESISNNTCANTIDKLFVPSHDEYNSWSTFEYGFRGTDYAYARGVKYVPYEGSNYWGCFWLRDPYPSYYEHDAYYMLGIGVPNECETTVTENFIGIRPACWVDINKFLDLNNEG